MAGVPILQALVIADHVYTDQYTKKKVIAGTFNLIRVKNTPTSFTDRVCAYVCLTNLHGETPITISFIDLKENKVLVQRMNPIVVSVDDPLRSAEIIFNDIPPLPLPHPGAYSFNVLSGQALLGSIRITVIEESGAHG